MRDGHSADVQLTLNASLVWEKGEGGSTFARTAFSSSHSAVSSAKAAVG